jgi:LPXTG-motif cell wall-anchored protein
VAWIQESAVLLLVGALLLAAVGFAFWWMWRRESKRL